MEYANDNPYKNQNMYVVEKILKKRTITKGGVTKIMYEVKWEGYGHQDNTWEPEENLETVPQMIEKFQKKLAEKSKRGAEIQANTRTQEQKRETMRIKVKNSHRQESQSEERHGEENWQRLRKHQDITTRNIQQSSRPQSKKENNSGLWGSKESSNKSKNIESNSSANYKKAISPIEIQDVPEPIKQYKSKEKVIQKPLPSKNVYVFGKVVNHSYRDGNLFYEVQKLTSDKKVRKIQQLSRQQAQKACMPQAYQYLAKLLISLQQGKS